MQKLCLFLVIAIIANVAIGMTVIRHKRQTNQDDENNLDDRYGGERPGFQGAWLNNMRPQQGQGQNQRPEFSQWQNPRPNQSQWTGQNQDQDGTDSDWGNQNQWEQNQQRPTVAPTTPNNGNGSQPNQSVQACITACPVTAEYNPVCGTNMVQYTNPGRLQCAQSCGVNVNLLRASPCPVTTTTPPPS